jgi:hypothetical protein
MDVVLNWNIEKAHTMLIENSTWTRVDRINRNDYHSSRIIHDIRFSAVRILGFISVT